MSGFRVVLEARDPARNIWRRYEVAATPDLFGHWVVEITFGRIGSPGRTLSQTYEDEAAARAFARRCLRQRESAPRRIGVAYQIIACEPETPWWKNPRSD